MTAKKEFTFVTMRVPDDIIKQIDELATEAMRSRSAQIILMIKRQLEAPATTPPA